jgi:hydrocephalus-inducing protein
MKFGKTKTVIPIEVKKGSKYYIELHANITIPKIKIENIEDTIDFGKVLVGQRKTFYIRLINDKEIICDWK